MGTLNDLASLGTIVLAPLAFWQKNQLVVLDGIRKQQTELRATANQLSQENAALTSDMSTSDVDGDFVPNKRKTTRRLENQLSALPDSPVSN